MKPLFESYLARAMLEQALQDENIQRILIRMAATLHQQVMMPLRTVGLNCSWDELSPALQATFLSYSIQHSEEDKGIGALLPHEKQSVLKETPGGRQRVLDKMEACLLNPLAYMTTIDGMLSLIKVIDGMAFSHDNGAHHHQQFSTNFATIKGHISPTKDEEIRSPRSPKHLARSYGSMTILDQDLVIAKPGSKGVFSGKARFLMFSVEKRLQDLVTQFDLETDVNKRIKLKEKLDFYQIPVNPSERDLTSNYAKKYKTYFEKLGTTKEGMLPLVAGPSYSTAKVFCMIHDLGLFLESGRFDLESAQIFANCFMAYHVYCGHHSLYEVMEIYNRQLDYIALEAQAGHVALSIPDLFTNSESDVRYFDDKNVVERRLPYGHIGEYRGFLHANYAETVIASAEHYLEKGFDLSFSEDAESASLDTLGM